MSIADTARKIPGVAAAEGAVTGALATEQDLPIPGYDKQTAADIESKLKGFSQRELRMIDAYERKHENRATITDKIAKLTGDESWSGYDEQSVEAITTALNDADARRRRRSCPTSVTTRAAPASSRPPTSGPTASSREERAREAIASRARARLRTTRSRAHTVPALGAPGPRRRWTRAPLCATDESQVVWIGAGSCG